MKLQKFRWSKVYESSEEELHEFLSARNITATSWHLEEFVPTEARVVAHDTTIWCAEGSANFRLNDASFSMQPGDGMTIPTNSTLQITAGMSGCICYEA
jgi:hypothetical protein